MGRLSWIPGILSEWPSNLITSDLAVARVGEVPERVKMFATKPHTV